MPGRPLCANHPDAPGVMRESPPGGVCRNYRAKPAAPDLADGTVKRIPLAGGLYAYVDTADYEWLNQYKWQLSSSGYAVRRENKKWIFMHRQIMQPGDDMVVDHMDGSRLNNCRSNLRVCTPGENGRNRGKCIGCASRFRGVTYKEKYGKWCSKLQFKGERFWLGSFDEEIEAARAYDRKAVECDGEFARVNLPEEWPPERRREVHARWQRQTRKRKVRNANAKGKNTAVRAKAPARKGRRRTMRDSKRTTKQPSQRPRRQKPAMSSHETGRDGCGRGAAGANHQSSIINHPRLSGHVGEAEGAAEFG
jgi:hypothetical protein